MFRVKLAEIYGLRTVNVALRCSERNLFLRTHFLFVRLAIC